MQPGLLFGALCVEKRLPMTSDRLLHFLDLIPPSLLSLQVDQTDVGAWYGGIDGLFRGAR